MRILIAVFFSLATSVPALAQTTFHVADEAALRAAITTAASGDTIVLDASITLKTGDLPSVHSDIIVDGSGHTLSGNSQFRGLLVAAFGGASAPVPIPVSVTIQNLTIADTVAQGGTGGSGAAGGGGGGGLGGALFVAQQANVTLSNVNFASNKAVGGNGGAAVGGVPAGSGGGGGGLGGNGGDALPGSAGGGGGAGAGADGGSAKPGNPGIAVGGNPGGSSGGVPGGAQAGGGGSSDQGGGGGGSAGADAGNGGGSGGFAGGGGGGIAGNPGGFGGTGGGGGGGGGFGGYGGGGGGDDRGAAGTGGGFGGGGGGGNAAAGGGGGAGMGGGVFVEPGGTIVISGAVTMNGNTVAAGRGAAGGGDGVAYGAGLFLGGGGNIVFKSAAGETQTIADTIGDEAGSSGITDVGAWTLSKTGAGTLVLGGVNQYAGGTFVDDGTLSVASSAALGRGTVALVNTATLAVTGTTAFAQNFMLGGAPTVNVSAGQNATFNGTVADDIDFGPGSLTVSGGGTVTLGNALNTYSGGTSVVGGSTVAIAADAALGAATGGVTLGDATSGGTLSFATGSAFATNRTFTLGAGGGTFDTAGTAAIDVTGAIVGAGGLGKTGSGTLTLSGDNAYAGPTIVAGGVLRAGRTDVFSVNGAMQVDAGATLDLNDQNQTVGALLGGGTVTLGAATLTAGGNNTSTLFSGTIGGTGDLVKTGSGALVLTGANTYSGGTTVSGGSLVGTTTSLQGAIQNDALVVFDQNTSGTYAGTMTGTGTLEKSGAGVVTLTGANTYSGGTTVTGGVLAGTTTSLQGNIANDAVVQFDQTAAGTYAGVMSGSGALLKSGAGTLTLSGANTYSGGTQIDAGTLVGDTTSLQGNIVDNAQLQFNQTADGTYAGTIVGTGSLTKTGTGTLTLSGISAYTGGTTVSAGTLAGTSLSLQGAIQNNASLLFQQDFGGAFSGTIGGTGSVTKAGSGALVLTGTNSYTGGTLVSGGSLIGTTSSLQGAIQNNAQVIFSQNANGTYAGLMSGTGSLATSGTGTLTLTANNTYAGGTSIGGGSAIAIGADTALGAASGGVTLGDALAAGTLTFTNSGLLSSGRSFLLAGGGGGVFNTIGASPVTIAGAVTGTGGLTKTGGGVLVLAGANSYTGPTAIAGGVLRAAGTNVFGTTGSLLVGAGSSADLNGFNQTVGSIGGSGSILLGAGTLTTGGDGTNALFGGAISGSGALVKTGGGALVLTGANTYSGGTQVLGGALVGDTTSLQGNILDNSLVQFDQNADGTYGGSLSGSGALAKTGAGTLTLSGNNTYSGGTLINGGAVVGTASSLRGLIVNNAQLTLGGAADAIFAGTLSGGGRFTKAGAGTLTLNGTHSLSGVFTVAQGTLNLNGLFGGSFDVASGATLRASGLIAGSVNLAGSLFAVPPPGTPALQGGTLDARQNLEVPSFLTIGRDLIATPGSLLDFAIGPGATPTIFVGGTASLNGTRLNITAPSIGTARSASFLALAAGNGLSMVNSNVTTGDDTVIPVLNQNRNSLFVTLLNLNVPLRTASGPTTVSVADAIDRTKFGAGGDAAFVIRELTALDDRALADALEQLGGQLHATVLQTAVLDTEVVNDMVRDALQVREMEDISDVRWWGETACQHANFKPTDRARGGTANVCTGAGGVDRQFSEHWTLGGGGSFSGGGMGLGSLGSGDYTAPRAFGYVGYKPRRFGFRGGGSAAHSSYKTQRQIVFQAFLPAELGGDPLSGGIDRKAESEQQGTTTDSWSEIHDSRKRGTYTLEGLFGIRRARISRGSFSESGALALSLDAAEQIINLTQTDVRFHVWRRSGTYRPFLDANYRRELAEGGTTAALTFSGLPNSNFQVQGIGVPLNTYSGRLGMTFATFLGQATFTYEFKQAPGQRRQTAGLRVRFK